MKNMKVTKLFVRKCIALSSYSYGSGINDMYFLKKTPHSCLFINITLFCNILPEVTKCTSNSFICMVNVMQYKTPNMFFKVQNNGKRSFFP